MNISVVVPAFNEEKRIEACIKSLQSQTVKPFEIIVVDNNSTDKTAKIAMDMGVKVISEKKQGLSFARNAGFNFAKGDIIARTDADTIAPPNWIERIDDHFSNNPQTIALSGPALLGRLSVITPLHNLIVFETNKRIFGHNFLYGPNMSLRKQSWELVKNSTCDDDSLVHEDFDLSIHLGRIGRIDYLPNLKVRTSARRMKDNPSSIFVEYLVRWVDMVASHKQYRISRFTSNIRQKINN